MRLEMNNLQAVIFDMNGTVLADEGLYTQSFRKVLNSLKISKAFSLTKGISLYRNWQILVEELNIDDQKIEDLVNLTQEEYKKLINRVKVREGFYEFVADLRKEKIKTALATSNEQEITEFVLGKLNLKEYFDVVVTANDVNEVKPNPEIFLLAAKLLKVEPRNSLVIEDAKAGIEAALAGGFSVIDIAKAKDFVDLYKVLEKG